MIIKSTFSANSFAVFATLAPLSIKLFVILPSKSLTVKSNFLCNLGYGDETKLLDRLPRFEFSEVCKIL